MVVFLLAFSEVTKCSVPLGNSGDYNFFLPFENEKCFFTVRECHYRNNLFIFLFDFRVVKFASL